MNSTFSRYLLVGLANTATGYLVIFALMYAANWGPEISNVCGYAVGLTQSFFLNKHYTYSSTGAYARELPVFLACFAIAYFANMLTLVLLVRAIDLHAGISQIAASAIYVLTSYFLNKLIVFRPSTHDR